MMVPLHHFCGYLSVERGLGQNSVTAYRTDLTDFITWLNDRGLTRFDAVTRDHILDFLTDCRERGFESATLARRLVSVKVFFRYLFQERIVPADITDVMERKCELIRMYKCQYRDGDIERRKRTIAKVNGLHSMLPGNGCAEGFMSFVQPLQGQGRTIFQELPPPKSGGTIRFQGARK